MKDLQQKSKAKSRLKELLVLISRCLALIGLVLAFSQPFLPGENGSGQKQVHKIYSVYIDNSFSTQNINQLGQVLEIEKLKAKDLIKSFSNSDKVQIITNDFEGRHQRLNSKQDALSLLEEIKPSSSVKSIDKVLKRQSEFLRLSNADSKQIFLFTDLQKSTFNLEKYKVDSSFKIFVMPILPNLVNNVFIDSCWFENPLQQLGFTQKLHARIVNAGKQNLEVMSAKLIIDNQQVALSSFSLDAFSKTEVKFTFNCKKAGFNFCEIRIEDYPISFDDNLRFTFNSTNNIHVCMINGKTNQNKIPSLFKNDSLFSFVEMNETAIDYAAFKTSDLIILNQLKEIGSGLTSELILFSKKGGSILVIPNLITNCSSYNTAFALFGLPTITGLDTSNIKTSDIDQLKGFYEGVFEKKEERMNLPNVKKHLLLQSKKDLENILTLQNGDLLLGYSNLNKAKVYLLSTSLEPEAGNFYNHALLVPTLYKICLNSLTQNKLFFTLNNNEILEIKSNSEYLDIPPILTNIEQKSEFIPESRVNQNNLTFYFEHQPQQPGFFELKHKNKAILPLAFNYSRVESDLSCYTFDEIQNTIDKQHLFNVKLIDYKDSKAGELATLVEGGKKLWKLFLLLALSFVLIEILLLRFLK